MGKLPTGRNSSNCTNRMKANINLQQIDGYQLVGQGHWEEARALFQQARKYTFNRLSKQSVSPRNAGLKIFAFHVVTNETWVHLQWLLRSRDSSSLHILSIVTHTLVFRYHTFKQAETASFDILTYRSRLYIFPTIRSQMFLKIQAKCHNHTRQEGDMEKCLY
jgi:hypothetical protein